MCDDHTWRFPGRAFQTQRENEVFARDASNAHAIAMIREYLQGDADAVFAICKASPEAAQWARENYDRANGNGQLILVAEVAGRVQGFLVVTVAANEAEILNMAVDPAQRRQGTGSALLLAAEDHARRQDAKHMYLEVRESNAAARTFYEKHGFRKTGTRPRYYFQPTENAVLMAKKVTG
jgi:ribosomal-protein-alanine acetyltransferase